jgi:hypothetical protein
MFSDPRFLFERSGTALILLCFWAALLAAVSPSIVLLLAVIALPFLLAAPIMGQSLFAWAFGMVGPLGGGFLVLGGTVLWGLSPFSGPDFNSIQTLLPLALAQIVLALLLYPASLGLLLADPYRTGFLPQWAGIALLALGLALCLSHIAFGFGGALGLWLVLSGGIFASRLHPSRNLWDSLVDPVAALVSIGITLIGFWRLV